LAPELLWYCPHRQWLRSPKRRPSDTTILVLSNPIIEENVSDTYGSLTTTISDEQIRDLNAVDLAAASRRTPGVTISRFNPVGSFGGGEGGAVYIRGLGASRPGSEIKTYIDGVPFYMGIWNHPLLDLLPVNGMERIDILKGPQPQTVGNTFGAFNLSPRRAHEQGSDANFRLSYGSFDTLVQTADLTGRSGNVEYGLAQGYAESDGHRELADGRLFNLMGSLGVQLGENWSIDGFALHVDNSASDPGQAGLPATRTGRYDTQGTIGAITLRHDHENLAGSLKIYRSEGDGNALDQPGLDGDTFTTFELFGVKWREQVRAWQGGEVTLGLDFDRIDGDVRFARINPAPAATFSGTAQEILSPFAAIAQEFAIGSGWSITPSAGLRVYDHNIFGGDTAPHAGLLVRGGDLSLRANYARGVNYPGLDAEVLSALIPALGQSWRNLDAETQDHFELGLNYASGGTTIDLAAFHDHLQNRYVFAFPPSVSAPSFINLGDYSIKGLEASIQQRILANWNGFVGVTLLDPSVATLPYAPELAITVGSTAVLGNWRLSLDAQYQAEMFVLQAARDGSSNTASVDDFVVMNARVAYALGSSRTEVFMAVENLFDQTYEYRPGYPMPGASIQIGLNLNL
jgi:iron complex outermembrane recepter protein